MRILTFLLIISLSHFTNGQNIFTKFQDTVLYDDFNSNKYTVPQKYNSLEISIVEDGVYRMKRLTDEGKSIAYIKQPKPLASYEVIANLQIAKEGGKASTAGLVLNGQSAISGGIFIEINNAKKFKVYKVAGNQVRLLSGSAKSEGWLKSSNLNKKKYNEVKVRVEEGYYDIFFNGKYTYTIFDTQFESGKIGLWSGPFTQLDTDALLIKRAKDKLTTLPGNSSEGSETSSGTDPQFQEVILIFKTKIDQQQVRIEQLEREVNKCKSMLNYDTTLVERAGSLESENKVLSFKLDSTSKELRASKKRLVYLESLKEDIEEGSNGDLVLNLTTILAEIKTENSTLIKENEQKEAENKQLKKDNAVLLREIERMRYLLEIQD